MNDDPYTKREQDEWRNDVKDSLNRIEAQTIKTNGRVSNHDKLLWLGMGAIPFLSGWMGWFTLDYIQSKEDISSVEQAAIQVAVTQALLDAFKAYEIK